MQSNMDTSLNKNKKRKSLPKAGNTPSKISKSEEGTPSKKASIASLDNGAGSPQKVLKKKSQKSPVNNEKNEAKLNGKSSELKQLPFAGTKSLNATPKTQVKKDKSMPKGQYLTQQMLQRVEKEGKDAVLKSLNERIDAITSRPEISKSAKGKIRQVKKMIKIVSGEEVTSSTNQTVQAAAKPKQKNAEKPKQNISGKAKNKNIKAVVEQKKKNENDEVKSNENVQTKKGNKKQKNEIIKKNIPVEKSMEIDEEEQSDSENDIDSEDAVDIEEEEIEDNEDESADDEEESADEEEESADDEEESADDEEESAVDEEESEDDDEELNQVVQKQNKKVVEVKSQKVDAKNKNQNILVKSAEVEQRKDIEKKSRYVLFVGNLGYSTTKDELTKHFVKAGNVVDVRIPTEKDSNKPRGFAYVEFADEAGYQKALDLNGSQLNNRNIKVEYTQGGNKKSENQKREIKSKNFKLHAMRKQGKFGDNKGPFRGGFKGRGKN